MRFLVTLLLFPGVLSAQGDCNDDYHPCRGLIDVSHPLLPAEGIPGGVPDGATWADTSGLVPPGTTGLLVQVRDPGAPENPEAEPDMGCAPLSNAEEVAGNVAFMERGGCQFGLKALHAQEAGAVGFVIRDDSGSLITEELDPPLYMYGGTYGMQVHIPGIIIHYYDGLDLVEILEDEALNVTLRYRDPVSVSTEGIANGANTRTSAAYPNPFTDGTWFDLALARTEHVRVTVHDVLGRRIAVLHNGVLAAGASHTFALEARDLPAGIYFARFTGETFTETRHVARTR